MPKATSLTPKVLNVATTAPSAATTPRRPRLKAVPAPPTTPLQIRLPRPDVKAIKVAAAEAEQTISEFLRTCFHAYMQSRKHS
jgi:hypothetical protein